MSQSDFTDPCLSADALFRIDEICSDFEQAWSDGQTPSLETYLQQVSPTERLQLLRHLLSVELEYRRGRGEVFSEQEYVSRFSDNTGIVASVFRQEAERESATEWHGDFFSRSDDERTLHQPYSSGEKNPKPMLEGYEVISEIAQGGMGAVYRVLERKFQRSLALKVMLPMVAADPHMAERFRKEALITGQLQHPGIPPIHDQGDLENGLPFFAMKLIEGETLKDLLKKRSTSLNSKGESDIPVAGKPLSSQDLPYFLSIFGHICQTLAYVHARKVIHRDLKPANIMVGAFGEVQVMDWGLARLVGNQDEEPDCEVSKSSTRISLHDSADSKLTKTGFVVGTPAYMAPEQAGGETHTLDPRCDVFGLGAILCQILTGEPAYAGPTADDILLQAMDGDLRGAYQRLDACGADPELVALARCCLAPDKKNRPQDAGVVAEGIVQYEAEVLVRLQQARLAKAQADVRTVEETRRRRMVLLWGAAVTVLLVVGTAASLYFAILAENGRRDAVELASKNEKLANKNKGLADNNRGLANKNRGLFEDAKANEKEALQNLYRAQLFPMVQAWKERNFAQLDELLEQAKPKRNKPDFRGWEWYYFLNQCRSASQTLRGSGAYTGKGAWCPKTRHLAAATKDGMIDIWDMAQRKLVKTLPGQSSGVLELEWHPGGKNIACAYENQKIQIWDVATTRITRHLRGVKTRAMAWSANGKYLAVGDTETGVKIWETEKWKLWQRLAVADVPRKVYSLDWHPDNRHLAAGEIYGILRVWDTSKGSPIRDWPCNKYGGEIEAVAWSPDGKKIAAGAKSAEIGKIVTLWDKTGSILGVFPGHRSSVRDIAWSPDGRFFVSVGQDGSACSWDVAGGKAAGSVRTMASGVGTVAWDAVGGRICQVGEVIQLTKSILPIEQSTTLSAEKLGPIYHTAWSPNGHWIASTNHGGPHAEVLVWNARTGRLLHRLNGGPSHQGWAVSWSPDGSQLASLNSTGDMRVWRFPNAELVASLQFPLPDGASKRLFSWSADGKWLAWCARGRLLIWDTNTWNLAHTIVKVPKGWALDGSVTWSPDGRHVAVGGAVWQTETWKPVVNYGKSHGASWSPNGQTLALTSSTGALRLFDIKMGLIAAVDNAHKGAVKVNWAPKGKRFVVVSEDGTFSIWDAASKRQLVTIPVGDVQVFSADWSPDGRELALSCWDGKVRVYKAHHSMLGLLKAPESDTERVVAEALLLHGALLELAVGTEIRVAVKANVELPEKPFRINGINLRADTSIVTTIPSLSVLSQLEKLYLDHTNLTDQAAVHLTELTTLRELSVAGTRLSDKGLNSLGSLPSLKLLRCMVGQFSPAALQKFTTTHPNCKLQFLSRDYVAAGVTLALGGSVEIRDAGQKLRTVTGQDLPDSGTFSVKKIHFPPHVSVAHWRHKALQSLLELTEVDSWDNGVTDEAIAFWKDLPKLEKIQLKAGKFTGNTLKVLADFSNLNCLDLGESVLTPEAAGAMSHLPGLKILRLQNSQITAKDLYHLIKRLPNCEIQTHFDRLLIELPLHPNRAAAMTFHPSGASLAAVGYGLSQVFDTTTGKGLRSFHRQSADYAAAFTPDGKLIVLGGADKIVRVCAAENSEQVRFFLGGHGDAIWSVAVSQDGKKIASGDASGMIKIWDLASGKEEQTIKAHAARVLGLAFHNDSERLASAADDGTLKTWICETGKLSMSQPIFNSRTRISIDAKNNRMFAPGMSLDKLSVWDSSLLRELLSVKAPDPYLTLFSPNGKHILAAGQSSPVGSGYVRIWDSHSGEEVFSLRAHNRMCLSLAVSPDGKKLASAGYDGSMRIWDVSDILSVKKQKPLNKPTQPRFWTQFGIRLLREHAVPEAIDSFETALKFNPKYIDASYGLGLALEKRMDYNGAINRFKKTIAIDPEHADSYFRLGFVLFRAKQLASAEAAYQKYLEFIPTSSAACNNLGLIWDIKGNTEEAFKLYSKAVQRYPRSFVALRNLGRTLKSKAEFHKAIDFFEKSKDMFPRNSSMANYFRSQIVDCRRLLKLEGKLPDVLAGKTALSENERLQLAEFCQNYGRRHQDAVKLYSAVFAKAPDFAENFKYQHRFKAAISAALAAAGKGRHAEKIDVTESAKLRTQALNWLEAELKLFKKDWAKSAAVAFAVHDRLNWWSETAALVSVRDDKSIGMLPKSEQQSWRQLWADVKSLQTAFQTCLYAETKHKNTLTAERIVSIHGQKLTAGKTYVIEMQSDRFDTLLKLEDSKGKKLAENDDIIPGRIKNSRLLFTPEHDGTYRLIATSYQRRGRGWFTIRIREFRAPKLNPN